MTGKTIALLLAIKNGGKYTKNNRILAPLSANGLISIKNGKSKGGFLIIVSAALTAWGETCLNFELQKLSKK